MSEDQTFQDSIMSANKESDKNILHFLSNKSASFPLVHHEPPERPLDSDCCGNGCIPCVMDIYREEMSLWEAECKRLQAGLNGSDRTLEQQQVQLLHPSKYAYFPIQDIQQETLDSLRIRCGLARNQTLGLSLGQHIIIRSQASGAPSLARQYTPVSPLNAKGYFELLIKVYPEGHMSQRVRTWNVGDKLEARGPAGHFPYMRNKFQRLLMLCAGTGIAPMCQVISSVLADAADETHLRLVYASRTYLHLLAKSEIDEWKNYWNFSCLYILSQELDSPSYKYKIKDDISRGHVTKEIVQNELGDHKDSTFVLICGTKSFEADMLSYLKELGMPESSIHKY